MKNTKENIGVFKDDETTEMNASVKFLNDRNFVERISLRDGLRRKFTMVKD